MALRQIVKLVLFLVLLSICGCANLLLHPERLEEVTPRQIGLDYEDLTVLSRDGQRLHAWYLPAIGQRKGTVLFLHGNDADIAGYLSSFYWLPPAGYQVFALDYAGFGKSEGTADLERVHENIADMITYVVNHPSVDIGSISVFGQGLGASAAIYGVAHSAHRERISLLIADSPFTSYQDIVRQKLQADAVGRLLEEPLSWTFSSRFDPRDAVASLAPVSLLLVHGELDTVVPFAHSQELYDLASDPKEFWLFPATKHLGGFHETEYRERLINLLNAFSR